MIYEQSLELMMEERDQFRAAVATSKSLNNFNCSTIIPTKLPIDAAGVSVTPGDATNSSSGGCAEMRADSLSPHRCSDDVKGKPLGMYLGPLDSVSSRSDSHSGLNRAVRPTSIAPNLAGGFCQISVSHFSFITSPHRFVGVIEQHQQSMRQMQNGYPATHKWYPGNDRVH